MNKNHEPWADKDLINALKAAENQAFKQVYKQGYSLVEALVIKNTGSTTDAQDVFQEVLFVLVKKLRDPNFQLNCALNTFLYAVARNILRYRNRSKKTFLEFQDTLHDATYLSESDVTLKRLFEKRHEVVKKLLEGLSSRCRQLLMGFYYEKKSMRQIGLEMDLKENGVKVQKHRCMAYLKKKVEASPDYSNLINE